MPDETAFITIREVDKEDIDYIHFYDKSGKAWNCKKPEFFNLLKAGTRVKVLYNTYTPADKTKKPSKYVNNVRLPQPGDPPNNTWPDSEPFGRKKMGKDFDPETSKIQTCINASANVYGATHDKLDLDEFAVQFPVLVEIMRSCFPDGSKSGSADDISFSETASNTDF